MKLLVLSDSHGNVEAVRKILTLEKDADMIVHLGDGAGDMARFLPFTVGKTVVYVRGNCDDRSPGLKEKQVFEAGGVRVLACHGHRFHVKNDLLPLYYEGKSKNAALCLYGHTHAAASDENGGVLMVNPGAAYFGRYAVICIENGDILTEFKTV